MQLNLNTFFSHYILHPLEAPTPKQKALALVSSITLGILTLGIIHITCALCQRKITPKPSDQNTIKTERVFQNTLNQPVNQPIQPEPKKTPAQPSSSIASTPSAELPTAPSKFSPFTPYVEQVLAYPGELTTKDKEPYKASKTKDGNTLTITGFKDLNVSIRLQNLFESGAQVIVNAANTHLGGGGGIDGAIHKEGSDAYKQAHRALKDHYNSAYTPGYAAIIDSGNLKAKGIENVIVVAGPKLVSNPETDSQLYSCYYNSLVLAHLHQKASIAFPSISTGAFNFPLKEAAKISLRALHDFKLNYPETSLKTVSIHFLKDKDKDFLQDYASALFSFTF